MAIRRFPLEPPNMFEQIHQAALARAVADIGKGEQLRNNWGPYVLGLRGIKWPPIGKVAAAPWCNRAAMSWVAGGYADVGAVYPFHATGSAKVFARQILVNGGTLLPPDQPPPVGALALWWRGRLKTWKRHIGIVRWSRGWRFGSIEGNVGRYPALVVDFEHGLGERKLIGFLWVGPRAAGW